MIVLQRTELRRKSLEENNVSDLGNQPEQCLRNDSADRTHRQRKADENEHARTGSKVAK
jgi:hypothetical protein